MYPNIFICTHHPHAHLSLSLCAPTLEHELCMMPFSLSYDYYCFGKLHFSLIHYSKSYFTPFKGLTNSFGSHMVTGIGCNNRKFWKITYNQKQKLILSKSRVMVEYQHKLVHL